MKTSKLTRVTLTGADDTVDPVKLVALSAEWLNMGFELEWGILIGSQSGHRFPSYKWLRTLLEFARPKVKLSLHICGKPLRDIAAGKGMALLPKMPSFQRCQLNWHGEDQGDISRAIYQSFKAMQSAWTPEIIFQLDGQNDMLPIHFQTLWTRKIAGLFDLSHGTGKLPETWPEANLPGEWVPIGFAGGLGPNNLREELPKIDSAANGEYWIDMETKLFEGLQFSFYNCVEVLEIVRDFVKQKHAITK